MKKSFSLFIPSLFILLSISCNSYKVINLKDASKYEKNAIIYTLPKTVISAHIEAVKTVFTAGPYCEFAEKYLSLKSVIKRDSIYWQLSDIQLETYPIADSKFCYLIKTMPWSNIANYINYTREGYLVSINQSNTIYSDTLINPNFKYFSLLDNEISYKKLSPKKNIESSKKDKNKRAKRDSSFVQVNVNQVINTNKTLEQRAEEAANYIYKIRKRRINLVSGKYDKYYEGQALSTAIEEIDREEEEYLSLFIGKSTKNTFNYIFDFTPAGDSELSKNALFRFSEQKGVLSAKETEGKVIFIEINKLSKNKGIDDFVANQEILKKLGKGKWRSNGFYYRIPDDVMVNIYMQNIVIASRKLTVCQYGNVLSLPKKITSSRKIAVEFFPEYGSLKRIIKK